MNSKNGLLKHVTANTIITNPRLQRKFTVNIFLELSSVYLILGQPLLKYELIGYNEFRLI